MKNLKSENGSITSLVIVTVLFFVTILSTSYMVVNALRKSQLKSQINAKDVYERDLKRVDEIVAEIENRKNQVWPEPKEENETINGMKILGRIGTQGDNLGSTINAKLTTEIGNAQNVDSTVYYSEKADANSDIENSENEWKTEATPNSKSYLIVVNKEIEQGEELNFGYEA